MKNKLIKYLTLSIVIISCLSFTACGEDETVEVVAPIESEETVEPVETVTEEIESVIEESTETVEEVESIEETKTSDADAGESDSIEIVEELDTTMYGIKNGNIRSGDSTDYEKVASLEYGATIHVTGKTANGWYRIQWGDTDAYCASSLLADSMPSDSGNTSEIPQQPSQPEQPEQPTQPSTPPSSGGGTGSSQTPGSTDSQTGITVGDPGLNWGL